MVGWLVQEQDIRLGDQGLRQGHPLFGAPGEVAHFRRGIQVQALQRGLHPLLPIPRIQRLNA